MVGVFIFLLGKRDELMNSWKLTHRVLDELSRKSLIAKEKRVILVSRYELNL